VTAGAGGFATVSGHGVELTGLAVGPVASGPATVAIRPDDILVGEAPAGPDGNRIEVSVEVIEYHGRTLAVQARLPQGRALRLRTDVRVERGQVVPVWIPKDQVLVFPGSQAAEGDGVDADLAAGVAAS
jgi:putative spermidine/putrescine transport system ATP-binding protein